MKYLAEFVEEDGDYPIYLDLRQTGSNSSIYNDYSRSLSERSVTLILDVLNAIHNELYVIALAAIDKGAPPEPITRRLDDFAAVISTVKISGMAEEEEQGKSVFSDNIAASAKAAVSVAPSAEVSATATQNISQEAGIRIKRPGKESAYLSFGGIGASLTGLLAVLGGPRLWLLIDEWSEVPLDLQPYLADMIRRAILPVSAIVVKVAPIEHRSHFSVMMERGQYIGIEPGADISADLNRDDFLVFENSHEKATDFFKNLIFKHYVNSEGASPSIDSADKLIQVAFTQWPVFEEFVRAVEGVPRDALNLAAKVSTRAFGQKIAMQHVRNATRDWYQQDKAAALRGNESLSDLLHLVIDKVIAERRARAFLFPSNKRDQRVDQLFDSRLLHILRKNISSHDEPGVRYDVYKIDYGCYVDLIATTRPCGRIGSGLA